MDLRQGRRPRYAGFCRDGDRSAAEYLMLMNHRHQRPNEQFTTHDANGILEWFAALDAVREHYWNPSEAKEDGGPALD